mmetsp:Transcript_35473/g.81865  ORF Transcript_35473/g.81865 Transcript_35473/m.81865 type:complete len:238 (-) Transcript_35473:79-792(-)
MASLQQPDVLSEGATTLMLRSTQNKLTFQEVMTTLNVSSAFLGHDRPNYDFVYMPWGKLVFVNFVDHQSCQAHFEILRRLCKLRAEPPAILLVVEAFVQGLDQNLAFFLAKSGWQAVDTPRAPRVYRDGVQIDLVTALNEHVTPELLRRVALQANEPAVPVLGARHAAIAAPPRVEPVRALLPCPGNPGVRENYLASQRTREERQHSDMAAAKGKRKGKESVSQPPRAGGLDIVYHI